MPDEFSVNEPLTAEDIQRIIDERVAGVQASYDKKIAALEKRHAESLAAARGQAAVTHHVPTHAGGPGNEITPIWSQYHQELAARGELTDDHLRHVRGEAPREVTPDE